MNAKRVLEIGTFGGYSAAFLAEAVGPEGLVVSLEADPEHAAMARQHLEAAGLGSVKIVQGDAKKTLGEVESPFDLIFIDADKASYPIYFEKSLDLLSEGGLIVLDNTLQRGEVLAPQSQDARIINELNTRIANDPNLEAVLLTVRDGVTLVRKRGSCQC